MPIKCYVSPKVELNKSLIGGAGVFAKKYIKKGEIVFIKAGHIVPFSEAQKYDRDIGDFSLQITDEFYLCPTKKSEIEALVIHFNHSCDPSIGVDGQVSFVALRDIHPKEELTCDYGTIVWDNKYRLECRCGSADCRKIITENDWKIKSLQEKYGTHFSWPILKRILSLE